MNHHDTNPEYFRNKSKRDYIRKTQEIIQKEGRESVSIRRIAREMHCSSANLYCHFQNRQELIYYAELIRQGQTISEQDEKRKNLLMKALGPEQTVEGQYLEQKLYEGDVLVLCTDGLYNSVSTEEAIAVLEQIPIGMVSLQQAVEILLNKALEHGARDNLTLIIYLHGKNEI